MWNQSNSAHSLDHGFGVDQKAESGDSEAPRAHGPSGTTPILTLVFLLSTSLVIAMATPSPGDTLQGLQKSLPTRIQGWSAKEGDRIFDRQTIFEYINGAGEVYRAYNLQGCLARRYTAAKGPPIIMDVFDMGTAADAFGVFTHDRDGKHLDVGQGGLYRPGWLSFWKDRFFVSIYSEEETPAAEQVVRALAQAVADRITSRGDKPRILNYLPRDGLLPGQTRFLHHHTVLNYHFYLSNQNILHLGQQTDAALGTYQKGTASARLLLIQYPEGKKAEQAHKSFIKHYLPEAQSGQVVRLEDGKWCASLRKGKLLAIVLEADTKNLAKGLLNDLSKKISS
jgi:hypothetical protein